MSSNYPDCRTLVSVVDQNVYSFNLLFHFALEIIMDIQREQIKGQKLYLIASKIYIVIACIFSGLVIECLTSDFVMSVCMQEINS